MARLLRNGKLKEDHNRSIVCRFTSYSHLGGPGVILFAFMQLLCSVAHSLNCVVVKTRTPVALDSTYYSFVQSLEVPSDAMSQLRINIFGMQVLILV